MKLIEKYTIITGAEKTLQNAKDLIEDGKILLENRRFPRAFTLFQLAMEEIGKSLILLETLLFEKYKNAQEIKLLLKQMRDHKFKTDNVQRIDYLIAMVLQNDSLKETLIKNVLTQSEQINKINDLKNYSLYTSFVNGDFFKPSEMIKIDLVEDFKFYAEIRFEATQQFLELTVENLEEISKKLKSIDLDEYINNI